MSSHSTPGLPTRSRSPTRKLDATGDALVIDERAVGAVVLEPHGATLAGQRAVAAGDARARVRGSARRSPGTAHPSVSGAVLSHGRDCPERRASAAARAARPPSGTDARRVPACNGHRQVMHEHEAALVPAQAPSYAQRAKRRRAARQARHLAVPVRREAPLETRAWKRSAATAAGAAGRLPVGRVAVRARTRRRSVPRPARSRRPPARPRASRRRLDLDARPPRRAERAEPGGQAVAEPLLGRCLVQRIEARLAHERRGNHLEPRLLQRSQPCCGEDLEARAAQARPT